MDTYSYSLTSSPSSYSNSSNTSTHFTSRKERNTQPPPPYLSALHSVRRLPAIKKKPIAPMPATPPKIYKVEPVDFRDVVQSLTAAPEFQKVAPPPPLMFDGGLTAPGLNPVP
ncbi:VQ motif-containing protein 29-like [Salvia splendens]|uniref:VQ motif-containing protein 29-like n=1 Tax=Salvia splendens TaxID=180675 RepID=UPI001C2760C6|nr:VQ motif-containing protein 29-like [Salvia splendens]